METVSYWEATAPAAEFESLQGELRADVVVVGGGITGITAAQLLGEAGRSAIVVEARTVGAGTTGYSTGNLHVATDEGLRSIKDKWGEDTTRAVARSRNETIDFVERTVAKYGLNCDFARRPHYIFPTDGAQAGLMAEEADAFVVAGLPVRVVHDMPLQLPVDQALRLDGQAQFHPVAYVRLLAQALVSPSCQVFERSAVVEIDSDEAIVRTAGGSVHAEHLILATHTPKGFNLLQTGLGPYREYAIGARLIDDRYPVGLFWSLEDPGHSIRSHEHAGTRTLIVIGEKHKTGQHNDAADYYWKVESYARQHWNVAEITYRWSGQHYRPADGLPYIGKTLNSGRAFMATGFGTNGLLYGPLAARIIVDEILGHENPYADIYAAKRFTPTKSAGEFVKENINVAAQYVRDWLSRAGAEPVAEVDALLPGEGKLVESGGKKVAVYRDEAGTVTLLSPSCTHLGCIVHWNAPEKSWDCPCHGSRFACTGEVLEGPALEALALLHAESPVDLT